MGAVDLNYAVIITVVRKNHTKEEAIEAALHLRQFGCRTEVVTHAELETRSISDPNQQDLTKL